MTTRKVLKEMLENCLGAAYQQEIRNRYQRNVEKVFMVLKNANMMPVLPSWKSRSLQREKNSLPSMRKPVQACGNMPRDMVSLPVSIVVSSSISHQHTKQTAALQSMSVMKSTGCPK